MNDTFDLGKLIKAKLKEQKRSISWLAQEIDCDRSNLSKFLKRYDIYPSVVKKISKALNYDIFQDLSADLLEYMKESNPK